jgi:hypothetical protein
MTKGINGLRALCVQAELDEVNSVLASKIPLSVGPRPIVVKLRRTFNMTYGSQVIKYWRIVNWPGYESDLSIEGLKEQGIVPKVIINDD